MTIQGAEIERLKCSALKGAYITHTPLKAHRPMRKTGLKEWKSQIQTRWKIPRERCPLDTAGQLHIWTHSSWKACTTPVQAQATVKSIMENGVGHKILLLAVGIDSWEMKTVFSKSVESSPHTVMDEHTHPRIFGWHNLVLTGLNKKGHKVGWVRSGCWMWEELEDGVLLKHLVKLSKEKSAVSLS